MQFSILINTHNQKKFIIRCLNSCIKQSFQGKYEILIYDTSSKEDIKLKKFSKFKYIKYLHSKSFSKIPELNQILKIKKLFNLSKGKIICLLDGDDYFHKDKLKKIYQLSLNIKKNLCQNLTYYHLEKINLIKIGNIPFHKNFFLYKLLFNDWPYISGTSSLFFTRDLFYNFFSKINIYEYPRLAVDIKLMLYFKKYSKLKIYPSYLTYKTIGDKNLSNKYSKFFSKIFWYRRVEQTLFQESINGEKINLNYLINKLISLLKNSFIL